MNEGKFTPKKPTHRLPVSENGKNWMFAGLVRIPRLFERAGSLIRPEFFTEQEKWLVLIWRVVANHYSKFNKPLSKTMLCTLVESAWDLDPTALTDNDVTKVNEFIEQAFRHKKSDWPEESFLEMLQQFLEDRMVHTTRAALSRPQTPMSLSSLFTELAEQAGAITTLTSDGIPSLVADGWDDDERIGERISTHIPFLDSFMDGGQIRGESNGLLGPTGGGKTTLSVMIGAEAAKHEYLEWEKNGSHGAPGRVYHVTYEEPVRSLRLRILSYLSKISRKRLEKIIATKAYDELSTSDNLQEYEKKRYAKILAAGRRVLGERERFERAKKILDKCYRVIDFTGGDVNAQARGAGLVDEIGAFVRSDMQKHGVLKCLMILADHVLAATECHIEFHKKDHSEMRHIINRWPWWMKRKLAIPFDCSVWSVNQLSVAANAATPGSLPKVSDSAEGRAFAAACDFCFVAGKAKRNGTLPFVCGKHRRTDEMPPVVLQIRGNDGCIKVATAKWRYDERTKRIYDGRELRVYRQVMGL